MYKKQALLNIVGNIVFLGSQWFMLIIVVRMLGYESAGMFSLAITLAALFFIISVYGMRGFQVSDINREYTDQQYMLTRWITISIGFLACGLYIIFQDYNALQKSVIMLWMASKSIEAFSDLVYGYYQNDNRFDRICISLTTKGLVQLGVFWLGLTVFSNLHYAMILSAITVLIVVFVYDLPYVRKRVSPYIQFTKMSWKRTFDLLKMCFPLVVVLLTAPLLQAIPRVYYEERYSAELFGIFSSVAAPTVVIHVLVANVLLPFVPRFAKLYYDSDSKSLSRLIFGAVGYTLAFGAVTMIAALFFGEFALVVLYGESIRPYSGILYGIIIAVVSTAVLICFNTLFIPVRRLKSLAATLLFSCGVCYVFTPYFVDRFEMNGIAVAMITGQVVAVLLLTVQSLWMLKKMRRAER